MHDEGNPTQRPRPCAPTGEDLPGHRRAIPGPRGPRSRRLHRRGKGVAGHIGDDAGRVSDHPRRPSVVDEQVRLVGTGDLEDRRLDGRRHRGQLDQRIAHELVIDAAYAVRQSDEDTAVPADDARPVVRRPISGRQQRRPVVDVTVDVHPEEGVGRPISQATEHPHRVGAGGRDRGVGDRDREARPQAAALPMEERRAIERPEIGQRRSPDRPTDEVAGLLSLERLRRRARCDERQGGDEDSDEVGGAHGFPTAQMTELPCIATGTSSVPSSTTTGTSVVPNQSS